MTRQSHAHQTADAGSGRGAFTGTPAGPGPETNWNARFCIMRSGPSNKISRTETARIKTLRADGLVMEVSSVEIDECHISYDENPAFRNRVILLFILPSGRRIKAVAQTVWFERRSDVEQGFVAGMKFTGLAMNDRKAIEEYLASLERKPSIGPAGNPGDNRTRADSARRIPTRFVPMSGVHRRSNPRPIVCMAAVLFFLTAATGGILWHLSKPRSLHSSERALAICEYLSSPYRGTAKARWVAPFISLHFDKPSVAVVPIVRGPGSGEDYYWDGMTADLIRSLAGIDDLHVFSVESVRQYEDGPVDSRRVNLELGAEYVLTGKAESDRFEMHLLNAKTGEKLWQRNYGTDLSDLMRAQKEVRNTVAATLGGEMRWTESTDTPGPTVPKAYESLLQGNSFLNVATRAANKQARKMYALSVDLDPSYARAYAMHAVTNLKDIWFGWTDDRSRSLKEANEWIQSALEIAPQLAEAHAAMAQLELLQGRYDAAFVSAENAVAHSPNQAENRAVLAMTLLYSGRSAEAITAVKQAMRLSPISPPWYRAVLGNACFLENRYEEALAVFEDMLLIKGWEGEAHMGLAKTYSELGRMEEARNHAMMMKDLMPGFSLSAYAGAKIFKDPVDLQRQVDALKKTGLT